MGKTSNNQNTAEPQGEGLAPGAEASQADGADATATDSAASAGGDVTPAADEAPKHKHEPSFEEAVEAVVWKVLEKIGLERDNAETFRGEVQAEVKSYLDANLDELVRAAMPPTPEQVRQAERESLEESIRKQRQAAERRQKKEAKEAAAARAAEAEEQAKRDAAAAKAFAEAVPFVGTVADLNDAIVRSIRIDDGTAYSADHVFPVRFGDFEATPDGGLLLTKDINLPGRGREFDVCGVSLITDAGALRIELIGERTCGGGRPVSLPARSLVFRPGPAPTADAA